MKKRANVYYSLCITYYILYYISYLYRYNHIEKLHWKNYYYRSILSIIEVLSKDNKLKNFKRQVGWQDKAYLLPKYSWLSHDNSKDFQRGFSCRSHLGSH